MAEPEEIDPLGVVPDGFCDAWGEDTIPDALETAERAPGTTDPSEKKRCPSCRRSTRIRKKPGSLDMPHKIDTTYRCEKQDCTAHFNDPAPPLAECPIEACWMWLDDKQRYRDMSTKEMPINTGFEWCTDLKDPADRESILPFADVDRERAVELAIRLREPWAGGGPSYNQIAELLPYKDSWVGHRVREWRDGEHRDLVEEPRPTVDATADDAIATDGGARRRRWAAYGSD